MSTSVPCSGSLANLARCRWATRNRRWGSPKFLAGESYGTTRAAGLSGYLQQRYGMYLNGIILISSILNFQTAEFDTGNDLPYILYLPTYTAIAWYHKKLPPDLQSGEVQKAIEESRKFAVGEYADALMTGDVLPSARRAEIMQKVARSQQPMNSKVRSTSWWYPKLTGPSINCVDVRGRLRYVEQNSVSKLGQPSRLLALRSDLARGRAAFTL